MKKCMVCGVEFLQINPSQRVCEGCQKIAKSQGFESYRYCRKHKKVGLVKSQKTLCEECMQEKPTHCSVCGGIIGENRWNDTCSQKCTYEKSSSKRKETNLDRYGSEYPFGSKSVIKKREDTNLAKYGFKNVSHVPEIKNKISEALLGNTNGVAKRKKTCIDRYGVDNPSKVSSIRERAEENSCKYGDFIDINGDSWKLLGTEGLTLNWLISHKFSNIRNKNRPTIKYIFDGVTKHYWCDFILDNDIVVESKSWWSWNLDVERNLAKIQGSLDCGFFVILIIWDKNKPSVFVFDDPSKPLVVTQTNRSVGSEITQTITGNESVTTITRV